MSVRFVVNFEKQATMIFYLAQLSAKDLLSTFR